MGNELVAPAAGRVHLRAAVAIDRERKLLFFKSICGAEPVALGPDRVSGPTAPSSTKNRFKKKWVDYAPEAPLIKYHIQLNPTQSNSIQLNPTQSN